MTFHAAYVPLLPAFDEQHHERKLRRQKQERLEVAVQEDVRLFHLHQRLQEESFSQQFKKRYGDIKGMSDVYRQALDTVVRLEFTQFHAANLLPEHIRNYQDSGVMPFAPLGLRPLTDEFFAAQMSEPLDDCRLDLAKAADRYRKLSVAASTRYNDLLKLNNTGHPAVELLRYALSGVGAHIHYIGQGLRAEKERLDALFEKKPVIPSTPEQKAALIARYS